MIKFPICYYPTKIIAVDDNEDFLNTLELFLEDQAHCETFISPMKALSYLNDEYKVTPFLLQSIKAQEAEIDTLSFQINIKDILNNIYNHNRFNEISTVIADFSMPKMNGLELCKKINSDNFRTIMLTGEAGYELAVDAFNQGLINQFLLKGNNKLLEDVQEAIQQQQKAYFLSLTKFLLQGADDNENILEIRKILSDEKIKEILDLYMKDHNIIEYYLFNPEGDFLLIDSNNQFHVFACKSETVMESFEQLAVPDSSATAKALQVYQSLKKRERIPYFYNDLCYQEIIENWDDFLHKSKKITGENGTYYYSFLRQTAQLPFDADQKIKFYSDYCT